jgi:acetyltransferase-like isoleucine patch superfamily enzyme
MEISDREILSYKNYIKKFSLSPDKYKVVKSNELKTPGSESNLIYWKGEYPKGIEFTFSDNAVNCRIFIGENIKAINSTISILSSNCLIYLGDRCNIKKSNISVCGNSDALIIGNDVTLMPGNKWTTGHHSDVTEKKIIVGDDCMFSSSVTLRAADGHPVFLLSSGKQVNEPHRPLIIEPHCWIGQAAIILKNVKIGACSIVAAGSVVTKSCRRYSLMAGVPAVRKSIEGMMWSRSQRDKDKEKARMWCSRFQPIKLPLYKKIVNLILRK